MIEAEAVGDDESGARAEKDALLLAILPHVPFEGWTRAGLRRAARETGLDDDRLAVVLPGGPSELARWLDDWADREMLASSADWGAEQRPVHTRVEGAVLARLAALAPYREAVRRTIAANAFALTGGLYAARAVHDTVDAIWRAAGDRSADFNYYTKRGLLAAAYVATALYWLNDESEGQTDTAAFLRRRIAGIQRIPRESAKLRKAFRHALTPLMSRSRLRTAK
jgi:ubiquinone biosynthesis protein COQ9